MGASSSGTPKRPSGSSARLTTLSGFTDALDHGGLLGLVAGTHAWNANAWPVQSPVQGEGSTVGVQDPMPPVSVR